MDHSISRQRDIAFERCRDGKLERNKHAAMQTQNLPISISANIRGGVEWNLQKYVQFRFSVFCYNNMHNLEAGVLFVLEVKKTSNLWISYAMSGMLLSNRPMVVEL